MTSKYEIVEFLQIRKVMLKKHPAAELPMMPDDQHALKSSIDERGIIQPLLVLEPTTTDGCYQVVDGCNRLDSAGHHDVLPCIVIRTSDPRSVALECLATGRRRSTGQRIMVFLMMHKKEVLKAAELGKAAQAGNSFGVSRETPKISGVFADFTAEAIADRLQVSREDVIRAVELFRCVEEQRVPDVGFDKMNRWGEKLNPDDPEDERAYKLLVEVQQGVMSGGTAVRTWRKAYGGKLPTTGPAGRPDVKYANLFMHGLQHLRTVLNANAWHTIKAVDRENLAELFDAVVEMLPDELRVRLPKVEKKG